MALTVILPSGLSNTGNFSVGSVNATGNVTGAYFLGNGACLSGVITSVANINNGTSNVTVVSSGGNITVGVGGTSNVVVFATTGEYVTGVVSASGNITAAGGTFGSGNISTTGNIQGGNFVGAVAATTVSATGNVTANNGMFTNIVNVASFTGGLVSVSGNITGANINGGSLIATPGNAYFKSSGADNFTISTYTNTPNPNFNINIGNGAGGIDRNPIYWGGASLNLSGNGRADTGTPDVKIDSAGNLSAAGTVIVNSRGNATAIVNGAGNAVGNIGSSSTYFNRLFAQATTALYADLAEMYTTDAEYSPGTVLIFGGNQEVTMSTVTHDTRVAGVVSTNPAHVMNSGLQAEHTVAVALTGRVPVSVIGNINPGDRVVSSNRAGVAEALDMSRYQPGVIIGKALQSYSGDDVGVIEVVVGRL